MGRAENRIKKRLEKNPIEECNRIQQKYYPGLLEKFKQVSDPRHQSYIDYDIKVMLGTLYYMYIAGISSMRGMTDAFNEDAVVENICRYLHVDKLDFLPHGMTLNEFLEKLDPSELEDIRKYLVTTVIRRKTFDDAKFQGKWLIIVDGTELDEGNIKKNDRYLKREYNKGKENAKVKYHNSVLEAKIWFGNDLVCSIGTEPVENPDGYYDSTDEKMKQDCESKAFKRLAKKLKQDFPRLPICLLMDGLYVSTPVLDICDENGWSYIIRYKEGSAPSIEKEYQAIPEKNMADGCEYINQVIFQDRDVNVLKYKEIRVENGAEIPIDFAWVTDIEIKDKNAKKLASVGRGRWKIENQGFNRQKNWDGNIEHMRSWNETAQKNHYLMAQIADFIKQLYEYFYLKKNGIVKTHKKISSDLLNSITGLFRKQSEDMSKELSEPALS